MEEKMKTLGRFFGGAALGACALFGLWFGIGEAATALAAYTSVGIETAIKATVVASLVSFFGVPAVAGFYSSRKSTFAGVIAGVGLMAPGYLSSDLPNMSHHMLSRDFSKACSENKCEKASVVIRNVAPHIPARGH